MTVAQNYKGFKYRAWAKPIAAERFQPRLAISRYHANRKETLEKRFTFDEIYDSEAEACRHAGNAAPMIIDGVHSQMTIAEIASPLTLHA